MYNPVNKPNSVYNLFLVHLSISTCFGRLWVHHQEKKLCLCGTCYLLFCVGDCLVCRSIWSYVQDSQLSRYSVWMTVWYVGAYATTYKTVSYVGILCGWLSGIQQHMLLHTRHSPTQNNKYKVSHKHSCFYCYAGAYAPAYQSPTQKSKYQMSHKYSCLSCYAGAYAPAHQTVTHTE
jgi:hypothetical protein